MTPARPPVPRRTRSSSVVLAALALLASIPAGDVSATSIRKVTLRQMVDASDTIVQGRVEGVRSFWQGSQILTEVTLAVSQSLKGSGGASLTFLQVGGRVEAPVPIEVTVPGAPLHRIGERGFYFLEPGSPGHKMIVGLWRGRVPVLHDQAGDYVPFDEERRAPSDFAEEIRRLVAGQGPGASAPGTRP